MADGAHPDDEYGPGGYLPPRAAHRARKIVLRERMGLGWPLAAIAAALVVTVAGVAFLLSRGGPPSPPFTRAAPLEHIDPRGALLLPVEGANLHVLVVRAGGALQAFIAPQGSMYCPESGRLEAPARGVVWTLNGRLVGGPGSSLARVPVEVAGGVVYVDPTRVSAAAPADDLGLVPACGL